MRSQLCFGVVLSTAPPLRSLMYFKKLYFYLIVFLLFSSPRLYYPVQPQSRFAATSPRQLIVKNCTWQIVACFARKMTALNEFCCFCFSRNVKLEKIDNLEYEKSPFFNVIAETVRDLVSVSRLCCNIYKQEIFFLGFSRSGPCFGHLRNVHRSFLRLLQFSEELLGK